MTMNSFSALIQLAATLSIAFVAVEYVRSYTNVLCEKFFKFNDFLKDTYEYCRSLLTDIDTLSHIQPIEIGRGKNTYSEIEAAKRTNEALTKEINEEEEKKKNELSTVCQAKGMSSMCFFVFLYSTLLLLMSGLEDVFESSVHCFVSILGTLSVIYLVLGWCFGEKEVPWRFCDFASLRHSIFGFIGIVILSAILCIIFRFYSCDWFDFYISQYWWYAFFVSIVITYVNFVVYVFVIRSKAKSFINTVGESKETLEGKCKEAEERVSDLMRTTRLISKLQAD